jgi:hypothetical protein
MVALNPRIGLLANAFGVTPRDAVVPRFAGRRRMAQADPRLKLRLQRSRPRPLQKCNEKF